MKLPLRTTHFTISTTVLIIKRHLQKTCFWKEKYMFWESFSMKWNGETVHSNELITTLILCISPLSQVLHIYLYYSIGYCILGYVMSLENMSYFLLPCSVCFTYMLVFNSKCQALNGEMLNMHFVSNCQIVVVRKFTFSLSDVVKFHLVAAVFINICSLYNLSVSIHESRMH